MRICILRYKNWHISNLSKISKVYLAENIEMDVRPLKKG